MSAQRTIDRMMASSELMLLKVCSPSALYRRCACVCMHVLAYVVHVFTHINVSIQCEWQCAVFVVIHLRFM